MKRKSKALPDLFPVKEEFDERQLRAIELLSLPDKGGFTMEEIAAKVGVSQRQLHRWRQKPEFQDAIVNKALENIRGELPAVFSANLKAAKKGNVKQIELIYKLLGMLIDRQEVEQTVQNKRDNASIEKDIQRLSALLDVEEAEEDEENKKTRVN